MEHTHATKYTHTRAQTHTHTQPRAREYTHGPSRTPALSEGNDFTPFVDNQGDCSVVRRIDVGHANDNLLPRRKVWSWRDTRRVGRCGVRFLANDRTNCTADMPTQLCAAVSTSSAATLKRHLAACKSLPANVRDVMDHAAVCESRAGLGRYGGVHAAVYRGFRVTGWE